MGTSYYFYYFWINNGIQICLKNIFFALFFVCFLGCDKENENLKIGTFRFYEGDEFIGYIYRFKNYQVEEYKKDILFCKFRMERQ